MNVLRIQYEDEAEKVAKLRSILGRLGYRSELANPQRLTVGELAKMLGRNMSNVSTQLRSKHCPPFVSAKGKKRILWLEPNDDLLSFLANSTKGQRNDLAESEEARKRTQADLLFWQKKYHEAANQTDS